MLIDTHAHLWWESYKDDLEEVLARAKVAGVEKIIVPGTNEESSQKAVELAKKYPGIIYAAVGVHPEEILFSSGNTKFEIQNSKQILNLKQIIIENREQVVAIGEIGTDKTIKPLDQYTIERQMELFRLQCELALEYDFPVIIHTRNSLAEALEVLDALPAMPRGQFHCFSHDGEGVKQVLERGFHVSFCGNITWSKRVAKLVPLAPLDRLLLETDSPFMNPGKRNEPASVTITAQMIADLRGLSLQALGEQTTVNAIRLFKL